MAPLTSVSGSFPARVVEARLRSEGIDVELRGAIDGPYVLTMGEMARVDVYVPADQLDDAKLVLLADEVDTAFLDLSSGAAASGSDSGAGIDVDRAGTRAEPMAPWWHLAALLLLISALLGPLLWQLVR